MPTQTITIQRKRDTFDVLLSDDGDHIVTKHNPKYPTHSFAVAAETDTWRRLVEAAQAFQ